MIACIFYCLPDRQLEPHGIFLPVRTDLVAPTGNTPDPVLLNEIPAHAQVVGNISVMMSLPSSPTDAIMKSNAERCLEKAKSLAKEAGAPGLVILRSAHYSKDTNLYVTVLYAQAVQY
jgi:hypothetical protein